MWLFVIVDNVHAYVLTVNVIICMETFLATLSTSRFFISSFWPSFDQNIVYKTDLKLEISMRIPEIGGK